MAAISGFAPLITHHCITGSMRHIYEFHDYALSEDMLLGLGEGVGFVYWHMKGTLPFYGGRANVGRPGEDGLEITAGKRTGVAVRFYETNSRRKAEQALIELLASDEPVMLQVDMGFLPYFDFPEEFHFGGHAVVAAGYDAKRDEVLIADRDGILHPVSMEALAQARGSTFKPFPPRNRWYTFDFTEARLPRAEEILQAIHEVSYNMLNPTIANLGIKGIRTAANRTLKWVDSMTEEELRATCFNVALMIDARGGTGGGLFRYMYGRFLHEAAEIVGDYRLSELGTDTMMVGDEWETVAGLLSQAQTADNPAVLLQDAAYVLNLIADSEESLWKALLKRAAKLPVF